MNKKYILILFLLWIVACGTRADEVPAVGLWEKLAVTDGRFHLVARKNYIFTNKKLTEKTIFTGFRDLGGEQDVVCCLVVKSLVPLNLQDILKKYGADSDFVEHMKSVKGLDFIYEADPFSKKDGNDAFKTIFEADDNPQDLSPYTAPVIAIKLDKNSVKVPFRMGEKNINIKTKYSKNGDVVTYEIGINKEKTLFSEGALPH